MSCLFIIVITRPEPCPANYTRMGQNCYHFSDRDFNWKSSASLCRGMGGHLVEFNTIEESQDVIAGLMSDPKLKGKNFWTGGLNPGLLWIWANSARPVHQDTKREPVIGDGRFVLFLVLKLSLDMNYCPYIHVEIQDKFINIKYVINFFYTFIYYKKIIDFLLYYKSILSKSHCI